MKIKKFLSVLLTVIIAVGTFAFTANAENKDSSKDVSLTIYALEAVDGSVASVDGSLTGQPITLADRKPISGVNFKLYKVSDNETSTNVPKGATSITTNYTNSNGYVKVVIPASKQGRYLVVQNEKPSYIKGSLVPFLVDLPMRNPKGSGYLYNVYAYPKPIVGNDTDTDKKPTPPSTDTDKKPNPPKRDTDSDKKPTPPSTDTDKKPNPPKRDTDSDKKPVPPSTDTDKKPTPPNSDTDTDKKPNPPDSNTDTDKKPSLPDSDTDTEPIPPNTDTDTDTDSEPTPPSTDTDSPPPYDDFEIIPPIVEKKVSNDSGRTWLNRANIDAIHGQKVFWKVSSEIPYGVEFLQVFRIIDVLDDRLIPPNTDEVKVSIDGFELPKSIYTVEIEGQTIKVNFNTQAISPYEELFVDVIFSTSVNLNSSNSLGVEIGNIATVAYLEFGADGDDYNIDNPPNKVTTNTAEAVVGEIDGYKHDNDNNPLAGAAFTLYSDSECTNSIAETTSNSDGNFYFQGLLDGTYYIKETRAPDGYQANTNVFEVKVDSMETGRSVQIDVLNIPQTKLPVTGGAGIIGISIIGVLITVLGVVVIRFALRIRKREIYALA